MRTLVIIPARYASTRFPGKPLALLGGKPIIQWVWECASNSGLDTDVVVATDDTRILDAVASFGGKAMMTQSSHRSGTDRCGEVLNTLEAQGHTYDFVVNIQGDEPFIQPRQIADLIGRLDDPATQIATLKKAIHSNEELSSPNNVKVICNVQGRAIYFSRHPLPYLRGTAPEQWLEKQNYYKHIGIYAFRSSVLKQVVQLQPSPLEVSESLEQLRWLENGYTIRVQETPFENIGIDTPDDLVAAERHLANNNE